MFLFLPLKECRAGRTKRENDGERRAACGHRMRGSRSISRPGTGSATPAAPNASQFFPERLATRLGVLGRVYLHLLGELSSDAGSFCFLQGGDLSPDFLAGLVLLLLGHFIALCQL